MMVSRVRTRLYKLLYITKASENISTCTRGVSFAVIYKENGDPTKVLQGSSPGPVSSYPKVQSSEVAVKMLAAPINPSDINMIQGVYPIKTPLPAVGGNEGVAEVVAIGDNVNNLAVGDWVVPASSGWGTWRTEAVATATDFLKIPNDIPAVSAATLGVNACTAYRMLRDFVPLQPDDVVIQNGGNSGVGQAVIQIAAKMGVKTINIVRKRENLDELVAALKMIGAKHVITDEFVRTPDMRELMKSMPKPRLAFNCVGGKNSAELLKYLDRQGTMVTYGGMSKQPLMVPAGPLIFSDVILRGYWMTQWNKEHHNDPKREAMWQDLCDLVKEGSFRPPICDLVPISNFERAVAQSMEPLLTRKQILVMDESIME